MLLVEQAPQPFQEQPAFSIEVVVGPKKLFIDFALGSKADGCNASIEFHCLQCRFTINLQGKSKNSNFSQRPHCIPYLKHEDQKGDNSYRDEDLQWSAVQLFPA
tara:strand:- start:182 stop:493 length:312 start_codon:yes stop_codon:yes gene_type:complete